MRELNLGGVRGVVTSRTKERIGKWCSVMKGGVIAETVESEINDCETQETKLELSSEGMEKPVDVHRNRYPYCIVWTPLPLITWVFPFIGHMGICTSAGVIRDFAGPYFVSEDNMGFGNPTMYWKLNPNKTESSAWDSAVHQASEEYSHRMHNLFCDNCHSHVARSLNLMRYEGSSSWNMYKLGFLMVFKGKFTGVGGFLKTWLPFLLLAFITLCIVVIATSVTHAARN